MVGMSPAESSDRPLRKDAERSRQRIVEAATDVFADAGLDVGYDEIARAAGVGVGTVYRRFPERGELYDAVLFTRIDAVLTLADETMAREESWETLTGFIERLIGVQHHDRALRQLLARPDLPSAALVDRRERMTTAIDAVIERAQAAGTVRQDLAPTDFGIMIALITQIASTHDSDLWRRYLDLALDTVRPVPLRTPPIGPPPTHDDVERLISSF